MQKSLRLRAFAKINLRLHVLGRRPDGYHELRTIFQAISLHDTLELRVAPRPNSGLELKFTTDDASLPLEENLVTRALRAICSELQFQGSVTAHLKKRIPVARGLGGGSSDAAAAMVGMLRLLQPAEADFALARLVEISAALGADVPFFLVGGRAVAVNRGDEIYPLPDMAKRTILMVSPRDIGVSTKDAYQWLSAELTNRAQTPSIWGFCALCWSRREAGLANDFEAPVFDRHPRLREIRDGLLQEGAADAALAGSGSAVFGVFRNPAQARRAARNFPEDTTFVAETLNRAEYGRAMGWRATL